jgi:hypothetical protein
VNAVVLQPEDICSDAGELSRRRFIRLRPGLGGRTAKQLTFAEAGNRPEVDLHKRLLSGVDRLHRFSSDVKSVGFEAGTLTQYLTYGLQAAGFEVICLEARQVSDSQAPGASNRNWLSATTSSSDGS